MDVLTNEELELYEILYIKNVYTKEMFDYDIFLKLYRDHLHDFCYAEGTTFFMNVELLKYIVDGFNYYHNLFIGNVDSKYEEVAPYLLNKHNELKKKRVLGGDFSLSEYVFMATMLCNTELINTGLAENNIDILEKLCDNAYQVGRAYKKEFKGS